MARGLRNTPQELTLCTYAALYDAEDFGGTEAIYSLGFRSLDSIKMKIQNIASMFDEEGYARESSIKGLSGKPRGESGRRTDWEFVSRYVELPRNKHLAECIEILEQAQHVPGETSLSEEFREGSTKSVTVNIYERNPRARRTYLQHYGAICTICKFNFGAVYGESAKGFIHVHHLKPLSEIGVEYELDPIRDMRPVCPNCHAVIHLGRNARSIEEVIDLINSKKH